MITRLRAQRVDPKLQALARNRAFLSVPRSELPKIARFFDEVSLPAGRVLLHEGRLNHSLILLVEGTVQVRQSKNPKGRMQAGDFFGEVSIESGRPARAEVVAVTPVRLLVAGDQQYCSIRERLALPAGTTAETMALRDTPTYLAYTRVSARAAG